MSRGASDKIRCGVVGTGYLGKFHAEKYAVMEGVDLVALVDPDVSRAISLGDSLGIKAYEQAEDIYSLVDAVSIVDRVGSR